MDTSVQCFPDMILVHYQFQMLNFLGLIRQITPKLLLNTLEQISIALARVFNFSLTKEVIPFEWKEANVIPLLPLKRVR